MKPFVVLAVCLVIVLLHDEVPPNSIDCISLQIGRQIVSVAVLIHSTATIMSYIVNID